MLPPAGEDRVSVEMRKWPDRPHWTFTAGFLGSDEHGDWVHVRSGTVARRGLEPAAPLAFGFVGLIPAESWWTVEFYRDHPFHLVYVNVGTPCVWEGSAVRQIDLDLDVVRRLDGSVEVLDQDEFEDHRARFAYPESIVDGAVTATRTAVDMLHARTEPFGEAAERWLDRVEERPGG